MLVAVSYAVVSNVAVGWDRAAGEKTRKRPIR
jgi:hypothetical protein